MTIDEIREFHRAEPFRPFKLCLSDGREYTVDIRMCLALDPTGRTVALVLPEDDFKIIEVQSIKEIKLLPDACGCWEHLRVHADSTVHRAVGRLGADGVPSSR